MQTEAKNLYEKANNAALSEIERLNHKTEADNKVNQVIALDTQITNLNERLPQKWIDLAALKGDCAAKKCKDCGSQ